MVHLTALVILTFIAMILTLVSIRRPGYLWVAVFVITLILLLERIPVGR